ncbi:unnamed protein product [Chondrus crispus]|uniref:Uncharacterized protein n=1 Tax=Chondrus crispus TaxID=2769 RepID=R7QUS0_CHOCR|nr:unnamed protein product [Chondrus crispus]CDF41085.1 unnamed protein product [Chondrus crispus]|eukprot:XP_005711379.1 unnamed protein product [Chondrus crispus]
MVNFLFISPPGFFLSPPFPPLSSLASLFSSQSPLRPFCVTILLHRTAVVQKNPFHCLRVHFSRIHLGSSVPQWFQLPVSPHIPRIQYQRQAQYAFFPFFLCGPPIISQPLHPAEETVYHCSTTNGNHADGLN